MEARRRGRVVGGADATAGAAAPPPRLGGRVVAKHLTLGAPSDLFVFSHCESTGRGREGGKEGIDSGGVRGGKEQAQRRPREGPESVRQLPVEAIRFVLALQSFWIYRLLEASGPVDLNVIVH